MSIIKQLNNKKIAILGWGIENIALVKYIQKNNVKCEIVIFDKRDFIKLPKNIMGSLGEKNWREYAKFDIFFRSPGWPLFCPLVKRLKKEGALVSSPMQLFFELCPTKNIIGVTGTKGKGTTSSLIYEIIKKAKKQVWLGGNIGIAPFEFIQKIKKTDWVVLELSSFQLEDLTISPHIAVITNFYPEHLAPADPNNPNYHRTLKDYLLAKLNIIKWQGSGDKAVLNYESRVLGIKNYKLRSKKLFFKKSDLKSQLIGEHNKENIAAAAEVAKIVGIKENIIAKAVKDFKGLEHRLEFVREIKGVKYYNDSFATTPESTITALQSFSAPVVLLAGGADKDSDFSVLAREIKKRVKFVVLLDGQATPRLQKLLLKIGFLATKMKIVYNIKDAVKLAREKSTNGDIVLLSTACASFGMFKNYKERGKLFKEEIIKLK